MKEMIKHPNHYNVHGIECMEFVRHMDFCHGSAFKYLYRCDHKGNREQDIRKAKECLKDIRNNHVRISTDFEMTDRKKECILNMNCSENIRQAMACICHSTLSQAKFGSHDTAMIVMAIGKLRDELAQCE